MTKNKNKGSEIVTKNKNKGQKTMTKKNFFSKIEKKSRFKSSPLTFNAIFKKFLIAFDIDSDNLSEENISKISTILDGLQNEFVNYKRFRYGFKILFILREFNFVSFEQLKVKLNLHPQVLSTLLADLQDRNLIKQVPLYNPTVQLINSVLRFSGDTRKRKYYQLNFDNSVVENHVSNVDLFIEDSFKKVILEDRQYFDLAREDYKKSVALEEEKRLLKQRTRLERIRVALEPLIGQKKQTTAIRDYLVYGKSLISKGSWKGKKSSRFDVLKVGGWEDYLIQQGYLQSGDDGLMLITPKVRIEKSV